MRLATALVCLGLAASCLGACASGRAPSLRGLYEENRDDRGGGSDEEQAAAEGRRAARVAQVRARVEGGEALSDADKLHAAAVLLDADDVAALALARSLALEAAEAGDERGFPLAAEAIDRQCVLLGVPQRYGTQYVRLGKGWALYPTDPATGDAERRAMGLPTLAEATARAGELE